MRLSALLGVSLALIAGPCLAGAASGVFGTQDVTVMQGGVAVPTAGICPGTAVRGTANVANASAVGTLAAVAGVTNYLSGFEVTAGGATSAALVTVTVANTLGGALQYTFAVPAGATLGATPLIVEFNPMIPATGTNTAITVTVPALGTGNTATTVVAHGCQF